MPNWCTNTLTVTGDPKEITRFRRKTRGTEPEHRPKCTSCDHPYTHHEHKSEKCLFGAHVYTPPPEPKQTEKQKKSSAKRSLFRFMPSSRSPRSFLTTSTTL